MSHSIFRALLVSGAAAGLIAGAGACSVSIHSSSPSSSSSAPYSVPKSYIADQITAKMSDASGVKPQSATCPNDLPAKVGAQEDCTMQFKDGDPVTVNAVITSVNGNDAHFDLAVTIDKSHLASYLTGKLTDGGRNPDSVTCPENLKGVVGTTMRCQFTEAGQNYGVNLKVTEVNGTNINFNIDVDDQPSQPSSTTPTR